MKLLYEHSNIKHNKLKQFIMRITAHELLELSKPCYYPKLKKNYYNLLNLTGLKENDIKNYVRRFYYGLKSSEFQLQKDPIANLIIFIMNYFLNNNDITGYNTTMTYFVLRNYANLIHKQIRYCNPDAFKYALEHIAKTHLFSREKTIANAIFYLSEKSTIKYIKYIKDGNSEKIASLITEVRTRVSQSLKSFAEIYYKAQNKNIIIRNPIETEDEDNGDKYIEQTQDKYEKIVDNIVKKICVYKYIDTESVNNSKSITKINMNLAIKISKEITNVKYIDNIKIIMKIFIKGIKKIRTLCGQQYFKYLRNLMSIKRTSSLIYFKNEINILVKKIIDNINYKDKYNKFSSQSKFMINLYVALYLTMLLRKTIC